MYIHTYTYIYICIFIHIYIHNIYTMAFYVMISWDLVCWKVCVSVAVCVFCAFPLVFFLFVYYIPMLAFVLSYVFFIIL